MTKTDHRAIIAARVTALTDRFGIDKAASAIGIPAPTLSRIRRGQNDPLAHQLRMLARGLGVSADYLVGLTDDPTPAHLISLGERPVGTPPAAPSIAPTRAAAGSPACSPCLAHTPAAAPFSSQQREPAMQQHPDSRASFVIAWVAAVLAFEGAIALAAYAFLR